MDIRNRVVELRRVQANTLTPHPQNWRTHSDAQRQALNAVLQKIGFAGAILAVERDGGLLVCDGHLRSEEMGDQEVPVLVLDLNDTEVATLLATFDPISQMAGSNKEKLDALLATYDLSKTNGETAAIGAELQGRLDGMLAKLAKGAGSEWGKVQPATEDEVPEVPSIPVTEPGDLWILGNHRLLCGDCTNAENATLVMNGEMADMLLCDPPYGVAYQTKLSTEEAVARNRRRDGLEVANDALDAEDTLHLVRDALVISRNVLKPGASFYVCSPAGSSDTGDMGLTFRLALREAGLRLRQVIVWVKDVFVMGRQDYQWRHEDILYGWKEGAAHYFVDDRTQDTAWSIPRPKRSEQHPTMKPVELFARAIRNSTMEGAVIYEPFSGSGTTIAASEGLGRQARAIELDPRYVDAGCIRWQNIVGGDAILESTGETFSQVKARRERQRAQTVTAEPVTAETE